MFGVSFGGGQQRPSNFLHTNHDQSIVDEVRNTEVVKAIARRVDFLLACYFPNLHSLYTNVLQDLCKHDGNLKPNWEGCCFAAASLNFQNAVTFSHRDYLNLLFGQCAVYSAGSFNYKKGGHLILWDLRLILEFPPGCIIFFPSAMIRHSNTAIQNSETRHSLTFFSASGLFRWRHNNFMSDKDFVAGASRDERATWDEHRRNLWQTGLELLRSM
ncbi:hypothetical protein GGU10DRAFT_280054 [Lentinula aff. detonsa]|uniref:Uncharacterized protein n=1 Tax=Lentinula aff. detonsa TaxID=2804958 RepID=A0AA38KMR7_9AGAR|nr:hypothetical protein GGU10DRAFT_280054 [Lentinula aff. detonsa]